MKKIIALILIALFTLTALSLTACGGINDSEVAILWSGKDTAEVPDSLINCIDRAMYIENINYKNYGANGNADTQYDQAKAAVDGGCSALIVEPVNPIDAGKYIELAKSKNIPIIFIGTDVVSAAVAAYNVIHGEYDKCFIVKSNVSNIAQIQGKLIADYVKENYEAIDRNKDGKISYVSYSSSTLAINTADEANKLLAEGEDYEISVGKGCNGETTRTELVFYDDKNPLKFVPSLGATVTQSVIMEKYNDEAENTVELIITDSDLTALEVLVALQSKDFNTNKLKTHYIPVFTVGFETDYKNFVLAGAPEDEDDKAEYFENAKYLCDLTVVADEDLEIMIWNTKNVISSGRLAGTVIADQDAIAGAVAKIIRNFVKGDEAFDGLNKDCISENGKEYLVNYIAN